VKSWSHIALPLTSYTYPFGTTTTVTLLTVLP
jgi:hypothetical protein